MKITRISVYRTGLPYVGGLSKARRVREYVVDHGVPVVAEDTWGAEIATATLAHLGDPQQVFT